MMRCDACTRIGWCFRGLLDSVEASIVSFARYHRTGTRFVRELHLEPKDSRPRTPSLLADDAPPPSRPPRSGMVADEAGAAEVATPASSSAPSPPRWRKLLLFGLLLAAVVVLLVYAFGGTDDPTPATRASQGTYTADPGMAAADTSDEGVAVILPGPAHDEHAGNAAHAGSADLGASLLAKPSSAAGAGGSVQNELAERLSGKQRAPRRRATRRAQKADSDVALLTALIAHVEKGGPDGWEKTRQLAQHEDLLEMRMRDCPRANTKAGLDCRKRICEGHEGQSPACPAPSGKD